MQGDRPRQCPWAIEDNFGWGILDCASVGKWNIDSDEKAADIEKTIAVKEREKEWFRPDNVSWKSFLESEARWHSDEQES